MRNRQHRTPGTAHDALGRAATKRIQEVLVSLGRQDGEIGAPLCFLLEDAPHDIPLPDDHLQWPARVRQASRDGRSPRVADVDQPNFARRAAQPPYQPQAFWIAVSAGGT